MQKISAAHDHARRLQLVGQLPSSDLGNASDVNATPGGAQINAGDVAQNAAAQSSTPGFQPVPASVPVVVVPVPAPAPPPPPANVGFLAALQAPGWLGVPWWIWIAGGAVVLVGGYYLVLPALAGAAGGRRRGHGAVWEGKSGGPGHYSFFDRPATEDETRSIDEVASGNYGEFAEYALDVVDGKVSRSTFSR